MAWSDPKTWTADDLLTASDLNQYVSDNLSALYALVQGGGRKNLLHNGAMQVAQRGTAAVTGITSSSAYSGGTWPGKAGYFTADRWITEVGGLGAWSQSIEADAPTGSGFRKSYKMLNTTSDASPAVTDFCYAAQILEGRDVQAIKKGTTDAQPLTLSFWTKSNKTGTYIVELYDNDNTRSVSATYTVASSGTWEQQTVTFPADLTGAFDNNADGSLTLLFWLGAGTNYTSGALATTWAAVTPANRAVGQTNLAASTNNYWQVTGAQLETGSASTGFEFKSYGVELSECQRYYYRNTTEGGYQILGTAIAQGTTVAMCAVPLPATLRVAQLVIDSSNLAYRDPSAAYKALSGVAIDSGSPQVGVVYGSMTGATAGDPGFLVSNNGVGYVGFSADL